MSTRQSPYHHFFVLRKVNSCCKCKFCVLNSVDNSNKVKTHMLCDSNKEKIDIRIVGVQTR